MTTVGPTPEEAAEFEALVALAEREHRAGRLAEATAAYRKLIALRPNVAEVHNNLGSELLAQGQLDEAAAHCARAVALKPSLFQAQFALGIVLGKQGKLEQARQQFEQVVALRPDFADAHYNLGCIFQTQGKLDRARQQFEQVVALRPNFAEAHYNLGCILQTQGQLDQALGRFQRAIALKPNYADAYYNLGNVLKGLGMLDQAAAQFERAIALAPGYFLAHNNLGVTFRQQGKFDQAVAQFEQAIALAPDFFAARNNLGCIFREQGKFDEAVAQFEQAIALAPNYADAYYNLGNALKQLGRFDQALANYDRALAIRPDFAEAQGPRAELKTFRTGDADLAELEALAAGGAGLPPGKLLYIHFALGKALEDVGDYPRAFEHWREANALKRPDVDYNEAASQETFRLIADLFDARLMQRFSSVGDPSPVPVFVLGMPRSGSTLIEQILASHPQVYAAGELDNMERLLWAASETGGRPEPYPACISKFDGDDFRRLGEAYLASLPTLPAGKLRIVDKMPMNFLYVGLIHLILPGARIIHTLRDPVDTCISNFSRLFTRGLTYSFDLAELGRYYRRYHELMAHWRAVLPAGAMLEVAYEDVVDDLETQARRLIDFCGLPWDERCLSFHKTSRPITTPSQRQVRQPLYRSSVGRWRRYEAYLQPLLAELEGVRRET